MFEYRGKTIDRAKLTTQELEDLKQEMSDTIQYLSGMLYAVTSDLNNRKNKVPIIIEQTWDNWDDHLFNKTRGKTK